MSGRKRLNQCNITYFQTSVVETAERSIDYTLQMKEVKDRDDRPQVTEVIDNINLG
jgi:hypothetical protein